MKAHAQKNSLEIIDYDNGNRVFALNGRMIATYHAQIINCDCGQWVGVCKGWNYSLIGLCGDKLFVRNHAAGLKTKEEAKRSLAIQKRFFIKMIKNEIQRRFEDAKLESNAWGTQGQDKSAIRYNSGT
ncbi:MAG: hypothetical protein QNJ81_06780 [Acidimicrobiia bacterium]|nr:hypothetical protein [Acidimicrobiia bacterium]